MLNVLLICSMGASTSILCEKIKTASIEENLEIKIWATPLSTANDETEKADIILLGPQIRYMKNKVIEMANGKPVEVIDMLAYGMMDAKAVLNIIKKNIVL